MDALVKCGKAMLYYKTYLIAAFGTAHFLQFGSKLFVDEVDEEVENVEGHAEVAQVAVDWSEPVVRVECGRIRHQKPDEQAEADLQCFLVGRVLLRRLTVVKD